MIFNGQNPEDNTIQINLNENKETNFNKDMKQKITESQLRNIIKESLKNILSEDSFENDYNQAQDRFLKRGGMWGMELKNPEGEWEYGNIDFDPKTMTMSCMGASVQVEDGDTIDGALEALYDELMSKGYYSE